jgi:BirA family biotin operon repressor/biotin-[acetyl-CoA-carboxylase] ligase
MSEFDLHRVAGAVANTRFGGKISHFATIDSTNIRAVEAANSGALDGTVFVADEQTAGRGRGGHSWHSAAGNGLYVSAIVRPEMGLAEALWLSLATGLAAQRTILESTGVQADIRWPNDLLIGTKKCGGILVETGTHPGTPARLRYAVIGIGINVNHDAFPPELETLATSLRIEGGAMASREALLANLLLALDAEITLLEADLHDAPHGCRECASGWMRRAAILARPLGLTARVFCWCRAMTGYGTPCSRAVSGQSKPEVRKSYAARN